MVHQKFSIHLASIFVMAALLAGCQPRFTDHSNESSANAKSVEVIDEKIAYPVWFDEGHIAFVRYEDVVYQTRSILTIRRIATHEQKDIDTPVLIRDCGPKRNLQSRWTERLPNGNVGYIQKCYPNNAAVVSGFYEWDEKLAEVKLLFDLSDGPDTNMPATGFAYSPDMRSFVYSRSEGITGELFQVGVDGTVVQLVPSFFRTRSPAWSPDGKWIAFLGNESDAGVDMDHITSYFQTRNVLFRPWDVYLLDMEGNTRLLVPGFRSSGDLQWKPGSNRFLSLVGEYGGVPGIWLIDVDTREVTRIWDKHSDHSWSPDGQQMMVIDAKENGARTQSSLLVFPVSVEE